MATYYSIFCFFFISTMSFQDATLYEYFNKSCFKGKAIVFKESYKLPVRLPNIGKLFTPTEEDIIKAERIFVERYNADLMNVAWYKPEEDVQRKYYKFRRQYLGHENGHRKIIINLLNFRCKRKAENQFLNWEKEFFIGFGEYYEMNTVRFEVDLSTQELKLY